jgi:predicted nucleotidyltransferase
MYLLPMPDTKIEFPHDPVIICYRGSHAHGTFVPSEDESGVDDVDLMGICIPTLDYYFGTKSWEGSDFWVNSYDVVTYSFSKFINLLQKGNPNCVGILWTRPEHIFYINKLGKKLVEYRNLFLGKETVVKSFKGYATSQMHKMTHFYNQSYYDELNKMSDQLVVLGLHGKEHNEVPMEHRELVARHNKLKKKLYQGYMGEKRRKLVDKFGYDCKNASHLLRLLTMCVELLDTGEINVYRVHDAQTFIDVKKGKWTLDEVSQRAEELFAEIREKYDSSPLPDHPDYDRLNSLVTEWLKEHYEIYRN